MPNPILMIHGWSSSYHAFVPLEQWLASQGYTPLQIYLGNYASMNDNVTFDDLAFGFQRRLADLVGPTQSLTLQPFSLDVIVHSTGGPVVRHWLDYYLREVCGGDPQRCPIRSIIMLAPANFGSRLAAQGKTALAKIFKGGVANGFQTGKQILTGLELGSPILWKMANEDLFAGKSRYPSVPGKGPFVYIFSGTETYGELKGLVARGANEDGSDGTVRASAASLDSVKITADYTGAIAKVSAIRQANAPYAFRLVPGRNHSTLIPDGSDRAHPMLTLIPKCLAINDPTAYIKVVDEFEADNAAFYKNERGLGSGRQVHAFQQFVIHVRDEMGNDVTDYQIDLNVIDRNIVRSTWENDPANLTRLQQYQNYSARLRDEIIADVEPHTTNPSYRTFFVNMDALAALQKELDADPRHPYIALNLDAAVGTDDNIRYDTDRLQYIPVRAAINDALGRPVSFFKENTSTLVEFVINRTPMKPIVNVLRGDEI